MKNKQSNKKVIFTLHDFGKTKSINDGIIYSMEHPNNIATQYSLMPNGLASSEAAKYAKAHPEHSFDLCITFTDFAPLSKGHKTLTDKSGNFLKADTVKWDFSVLDKYDDREVENEIAAQYEWFLKKVGRKPSALTTQKSEHGDPKILVPFADLAKSEGLPIRAPAWEWFGNYAAQSYVEDLGLKSSTNLFVATKDWKGKNGFSLEEDTDNIIDAIRTAPGISEILALVGFVDKELLELSSVSWHRGEYINLLVRKPEILLMFTETFNFINFKDLK